MSKNNYSQKNSSNLPHQNSIVKNSDITYPTPQKKNLLVIPDFSPITIRENKFGVKTNGSYKKPTKIEPESPVKTPNTNYFTPMKIEGKDLFGTKKNNQFCRKLNFDDLESYNSNNKITDSDLNNFLNRFNINSDHDNFNNSNNINPINKIKVCNNKMEKDFTVIKTIKEWKYDAAYIVKENKTGKLFFIKKCSKKSKKNNFATIDTIFNDLQNKNTNLDDNRLGEEFCMKYIDYWAENENNELLNKNLYILLDYYPFGDILDYLGHLEKNINFKFTTEFYWDIIFEMIVGLLYFHNKGYIHFDIKPTNFIVDNNGYIKLNDFGLCHKIEELSLIDDIIEGDSRYISKELFDNNDKISLSNIDNRCDVFSLGLSFLEIIGKIELPENGKLWRDIRNENFIIKEELFNYCNISNNKDFLKLINQMISPINKRPTLIEIIKNFPELSNRYELLKNNKYKNHMNF